MNESSDQLASAAADLPVEVQVKLAEGVISLQQLAALAPGDSLPIRTSFPAARAMAGGQAFAEVEIIETAGAHRLRVCSVAGD